jgi:hypothetical protein
MWHSEYGQDRWLAEIVFTIQGAEQGTLDPAERRELNGISERMNLSRFRPAAAA